VKVAFVVVTALALAATIPACAGDGDEPPFEADAGPEPARQPPPHDAGSSSPAEGGSGPPPIPVDCPPGSAIEVEPNDTEGEANEFSELSFCGVLSPGSDVDFSAFRTPDRRKLVLFQAVIDGQVDFELRVSGKTFGPADTEQFTSGDYLVKAFTRDGEPGRYRFRIAFE
jgi:hypothetical protein